VPSLRLPRLSWQSGTSARDEERGLARDQEKEGDKDTTEAEWFTPLVVASFAVALLAVVGYALAEDWNIQILALALLIAGGAFVTGGLLGFLFGIPRALTGRAEDDVESGRGYGANTNLEQISDWLTKILVGVGLVQITTIGRHFGDLITFLGPALGGDPYGESFAAATLIIFGVSGFLVFYLLTRIDLPPALAQADRLSVRTLERKLAEVRQTAEEVKQTQREQEERDVLALTLLGRQLTPEPGAPSIKQDELDEAIAGA
jgi:hypothetical protein